MNITITTEFSMLLTYYPLHSTLSTALEPHRYTNLQIKTRRFTITPSTNLSTRLHFRILHQELTYLQTKFVKYLQNNFVIISRLEMS